MLQIVRSYLDRTSRRDPGPTTTRSRRNGAWSRRGTGIAALASATAMAWGSDTEMRSASLHADGARERQALAQPGPAATAGARPASVAGDGPARMITMQAPTRPPLMLPSEGTMPPLAGAVEWLNSPPLTAAGLRGKVVLVDFWTFGCINCRHALPYVREWHRKYKDQGLVVVGVHTPEFADERNIDNLKKALRDLDVSFPVAVDNDLVIWRAFRNRFWPAHYFVDAQGQIRFHHFGEGEYEKSERVIRQLLDEARKEAKSS